MKPFVFFFLLATACQVTAQMQLQSSAFHSQDMISSLYTCDGKDISPPLSWQGAPANTRSFVLIMSDPDAPMGVWYHWLVYNISPNTKGFTASAANLPRGALQGVNSWGSVGYRGPCPPKQQVHRYFFNLYALNTTLPLAAKATQKKVEQAMSQHVLAIAQLQAKYVRKKE